MCVILLLKPGCNIPYKKFENAVFNNPDGWGIVLRDDNRIEVKKECPANGNDPEEIYRILDQNKDIERYVHLRWKTDGDINLDNTHPFEVYNSNTRRVLFMHNGVLHTFKDAAKWEGGRQVFTGDKSDSFNFATKFLQPVLLGFNGVNGRADYQDPTFQMVLDKFWSTSGNRGVLISNDLDPLILSPSSWKEIDSDQEGVKISCSNDTYFNVVSRGPEFDRRKTLEDLKKQKSLPMVQDNTSVKPLENDYFNKQISLSEDLVTAFEDYDLMGNDDWESLAAITYDEFLQAAKLLDSMSIALLLVNLTTVITSLMDDMRVLEGKKKKAEQKIAELVEVNRSQEQDTTELISKAKKARKVKK